MIMDLFRSSQKLTAGKRERKNDSLAVINGVSVQVFKYLFFSRNKKDPRLPRARARCSGSSGTRAPAAVLALGG